MLTGQKQPVSVFSYFCCCLEPGFFFGDQTPTDKPKEKLDPNQQSFHLARLRYKARRLYVQNGRSSAKRGRVCMSALTGLQTQ